MTTARKPSDPSTAAKFWRAAPRGTAAALLLGLQRAVVLLPWPAQRALGAVVGSVAMRFSGRRRAVVDDNLATAYPGWGAEAREAMRRRHFREVGRGLVQIGMAWWAGDRRIARLVDIDGLEHLPVGNDAPPALLVCGHFTTLDLLARAIALYAPIDLVYRPLGAPVADAVTRWRRTRFVQRLVDKRQPRDIVTAMRERRSVVIAVDQADTTSGAVAAPFFGRPALTNTTASRLAGRYGARVLPVSCIRTTDGRIRVRIEPPLEDFGSDPVADATRLNAVLERHVNEAPAQYFWMHRRFKGPRAA